MTFRDDVVAYQSVNQCDEGFIKKRLLLRLRVSTIEILNPSSDYLDLFDPTSYDVTDTADYLYLRIFPQYSVENDVLGEVGLKNTFGSAAVFAPANTRRGFKATITDQRKLIFDLVKRIQQISQTSSYTQFSPAKIIDFCHPELADEETLVSSFGEFGNIRYGAIALDNSIPQLVQSSGRDYLASSWGFTFKESKLRSL